MQVTATVPVWLGEIVKAHIERLKLLRLEGEPLAEAMGEVTRIWAETLAGHRHWDKARDTPRLHQGFARLTATCKRWPAPAHLLEALPDIPLQPYLSLPAISSEQQQKNLRRIARILTEAIDQPARKTPSPRPARPRPSTRPALTPAQEEALLAEARERYKHLTYPAESA